MRVAVAGHGATGHMYPLLGFADALLAAGHDVIILTRFGPHTVAHRPRVCGGGGRRNYRVGVRSSSLQIPGADHEPAHEQAWRLDAELFADALPRAMAPALVTAFESRRPDLVLYESTNLGAVLAAAEVNIPAVCLDLWAVGRWHVQRDELEQRVRAVWAERSAVRLALDPLLGRAHLDPAPASLRNSTTIEGDSIRLPTRQIAWGDPRTSPTSWLTRQHSRPVVYLTLGTVGWGTVDLMRADTLARSGAGLALSQGGVRAAAVRDSVRQLMDDPSHRAAANRLRSEILALPTPAARNDDLIALLV
jgi:hypothetical protein